MVADNTRAIAWLNSSDGAKGINRPKSLVEALIGEKKTIESAIETFETGQDFDDEWRRLTGGEKQWQVQNLQKHMCRLFRLHRESVEKFSRQQTQRQNRRGFGGKLVGKLKGIIATAAIGKALGSAISEGANLEQSLGGIETLFKDSADKVKANAAEAYRTAGMSANEYMELTTSFSASLLSSLSNDTSKAADVADMAMTDMSDNANKMGTNMEDIKNAYQGFSKQNYTMLDNLKLGYGGTKTEMERLLTDAQKITGVKYDINNLSDVYSAIHVIQGQLDITGTTAKEAATTISGSFASMKAAAQNVMGQIALGMDIKPALSALAETMTTFLVGNLLPAVWNVISALPGALVTFIQTATPQLATALMQFVPEIASQVQTALPQLYEMANGMLLQITTAIQTNLPGLLQQGVEIVTNIANGILQNIPQLISMAATLMANFENAIWSALPLVLAAGGKLILNRLQQLQLKQWQK